MPCSVLPRDPALPSPWVIKSEVPSPALSLARQGTGIFSSGRQGHCANISRTDCFLQSQWRPRVQVFNPAIARAMAVRQYSSVEGGSLGPRCPLLLSVWISMGRRKPNQFPFSALESVVTGPWPAGWTRRHGHARAPSSPTRCRR